MGITTKEERGSKDKSFYDAASKYWKKKRELASRTASGELVDIKKEQEEREQEEREKVKAFLDSGDGEKIKEGASKTKALTRERQYRYLNDKEYEAYLKESHEEEEYSDALRQEHIKEKKRAKKAKKHHVETKISTIIRKGKNGEEIEERHIETPRTISHQKYISSEWWKKRREEMLNKYGCQCEICKATDSNSIQVHHNNYFLKGREIDDDLAIICKECHIMTFHKNGGSVACEKRTNIARIDEKTGRIRGYKYITDPKILPRCFMCARRATRQDRKYPRTKFCDKCFTIMSDRIPEDVSFTKNVTIGDSDE